MLYRIQIGTVHWPSHSVDPGLLKENVYCSEEESDVVELCGLARPIDAHRIQIGTVHWPPHSVDPGLLKENVYCFGATGSGIRTDLLKGWKSWEISPQ